MTGDGQQINAQLIHAGGDLAHRLGRVGMQQHPAPLRDFRDFFERLQRACFIVGMHDGY